MLSNLFVNDIGLLCLDMVDYVVIDVGVNGVEFGGKLIGFGINPNVYSIYSDPFLVFSLLRADYGLFVGEDYVEGLYSIGYMLGLRSLFTKD